MSCFPRPQEASFAVNKTRPVNLDLGTISLPVTAKASILHRVSGVFLVAAVAVLLYVLELSGEAGFAGAVDMLGSPMARLVIWAVLAGLIYHAVAGVKHLLMDLGVGETLEGGVKGARITFAVSGILIAAAGVWVW